jgi:SAM-dependent methyltransferase
MVAAEKHGESRGTRGRRARRAIRLAGGSLFLSLALVACGAEGGGRAASSPADGTAAARLVDAGDLTASGAAGSEADAATDTGVYTLGRRTRDGIGKYYYGREISQVMGHLGAGWLERPDREREERTDLLIDALPLAPDATVADIGAGTGYFSFRMAERVPLGQVLAVDIQPEMLDIIRQRRAQGAGDNVVPVQGSVTDPNLPEGGVDLILLVDAYHEFSHPAEMGRAMARSLSPDGRLVLIEYRAEDPSVPIKPLHKMSEDQARREMAAAGLEWERTEDFLPQQHFMVFRRDRD